MAVVCLVLGLPPVLDVVAFAFFALHDLMDGARGGVLSIVVVVMSELSLFALAVALVDVATSAATTPVLVEVARRSTPGAAFARGWLTSSWIVGSLLCAGRLDRLRECRLDVDAADLDVALLSSTRPWRPERRPWQRWPRARGWPAGDVPTPHLGWPGGC
jgi:hypothetical protein